MARSHRWTAVLTFGELSRRLLYVLLVVLAAGPVARGQALVVRQVPAADLSFPPVIVVVSDSARWTELWRRYRKEWAPPQHGVDPNVPPVNFEKERVAVVMPTAIVCTDERFDVVSVEAASDQIAITVEGRTHRERQLQPVNQWPSLPGNFGGPGCRALNTPLAVRIPATPRPVVVRSGYYGRTLTFEPSSVPLWQPVPRDAAAIVQDSFALRAAIRDPHTPSYLIANIMDRLAKSRWFMQNPQELLYRQDVLANPNLLAILVSWDVDAAGDSLFSRHGTRPASDSFPNPALVNLLLQRLPRQLRNQRAVGLALLSNPLVTEDRTRMDNFLNAVQGDSVLFAEGCRRYYAHSWTRVHVINPVTHAEIDCPGIPPGRPRK